jgi:hypothetical protein
LIVEGGCEFTVTAALSELLFPKLSITANRNTYTPCIKLLIRVVGVAGVLRIAAPGPADWFQVVDTIVLLPGVAIPNNVMELAGRVITWLPPASAEGAREAFTKTWVREVVVTPILSVADSWKI